MPTLSDVLGNPMMIIVRAMVKSVSIGQFLLMVSFAQSMIGSKVENMATVMCLSSAPVGLWVAHTLFPADSFKESLMVIILKKSFAEGLEYNHLDTP